MKYNKNLVCFFSFSVFTAGADIKEMQKFESFSQVYNNNFIDDWHRVAKCKKPILAAVNGFAVC